MLVDGREINILDEHQRNVNDIFLSRIFLTLWTFVVYKKNRVVVEVGVVLDLVSRRLASHVQKVNRSEEHRRLVSITGKHRVDLYLVVNKDSA